MIAPFNAEMISHIELLRRAWESRVLTTMSMPPCEMMNTWAKELLSSGWLLMKAPIVFLITHFL